MARKRGYNWRPDDDAKDVPYHVASEAKRYARLGLIRAGIKKGTLPDPSVEEQQRRLEAIQRRNRHFAFLMEQGIDPLRPELGKAPKGSFLATQLQAAAARYRQSRKSYGA